MKWAMWYEENAGTTCQIKVTHLDGGKIIVSTIFRPVSVDGSDLWETMIFDEAKRDFDYHCERDTTRELAIETHERLVKALNKILGGIDAAEAYKELERG